MRALLLLALFAQACPTAQPPADLGPPDQAETTDLPSGTPRWDADLRWEDPGATWSTR